MGGEGLRAACLLRVGRCTFQEPLEVTVLKSGRGAGPAPDAVGVHHCSGARGSGRMWSFPGCWQQIRGKNSNGNFGGLASKKPFGRRCKAVGRWGGGDVLPGVRPVPGNSKRRGPHCLPTPFSLSVPNGQQKPPLGH